uniref:Uncharacterized protein n=1 Tax=Rhizophora mucronata TaxID=61149 RepID=A0A2P2NCF0_RHIMU
MHVIAVQLDFVVGSLYELLTSLLPWNWKDYEGTLLKLCKPVAFETSHCYM